jgi:Kef-type K+ transport system membrane component KefB
VDLTELTIHFFMQLAIILAVCRVVGLLARKLGQPQVVGEMIAGVLLGPSLFGTLFPEAQEALFPQGPAMAILYVTSQLGLVLYMFLVGLSFDAGLIRRRVKSAVSVSAAGILMPALLGSAVALLLLTQPEVFFTEHIGTGQAMLFMSAAIAVTAFPMLARIIVERRMTGTSLGTLVLGAGAADDAVSWLLFALLTAIINENPLIVILAVAGGAAYTIFLLTVGRKAMRGFESRTRRDGEISPTTMSLALLLLMLAAWITDAIGIYAIFGSFILGIAMPRGEFSSAMHKTLEPLVTALLLPLFFVFSGLNVSIGLLNDPGVWGFATLILFTAIAGKGIACWGAARLNGFSNRDSLAIGSLMSSRGLMELILLNLALDAGVITETLFTILVLMAIVTTLMATPLFNISMGKPRVGRAISPDGEKPHRGGVRES